MHCWLIDTVLLSFGRQHWFISRLNDASVTAGGFPPRNSNVLIVTTSCNEVFVFDLEAKQLGEWSKRHSYHLPQRFQEFPGEIIGLSFLPFSFSTSVIVYSARYDLPFLFTLIIYLNFLCCAYYMCTCALMLSQKGN